MHDDVKQYLSDLKRDSHPDRLYAHSQSFLANSDSEEAELSHEGELAVDLYKSGHHLVIEAPIGGIRSEDLDIQVNTTSVLIKGQRHRDHQTKKGEYIIDECHWGSFSREIGLPQEVDVDNTEATVKNGVLRVVLPILRG